MRSNSSIGKILNWFFRPLIKHRGEQSYKEFIDSIFHISERDITDYVTLQEFNILGAHKTHRLGKTNFARGTINPVVKRGTIITVRRDYSLKDTVEYEFLDPTGSVPRLFTSTLAEWEQNIIFMSRLPEGRNKRRDAVKRARRP